MHHDAYVPEVGTLTCLDLVVGGIGSDPKGFTSSGGSVPVFFSTKTEAEGEELWITDGTAANTRLILDICKGKTSSIPRYLTWFRGKIYFQADDCIHGIELWVSGGTAASTYIVKDIRKGRFDSSPSFLTVLKSPLDGSDYLMFAATDGFAVAGMRSIEGYGGCQLWRSDGTFLGTSRAMMRTSNDFYMDRESLDAAYPSRMGVFQNGLYLAASYGTHDLEMPKGGSR